MNRTGLAIALIVGVVVGVLFGVYPRLDLDISAHFYNRQINLFAVNAQPWVMDARAAARWLITLLVAPAGLACIGKLIMPNRRMLIGGRAALFLVATLALGPGVLTNVILKDHWGRARPIDVAELGGTFRFTAWWDPRGDCPDNCSFIAGEPSGAIWTLAPAALAPPQWRLLAYAGALAFGAAVGLMRIAAGGHFFTDVVFAGVFNFLLIWTAHGLLFRWAATRTTDEAIERPLARAGEAIRRAVAALSRRLGGQAGKPS
ncbi:MAG TPA: phosphatase PAP2 family protein [Xanthobacteraceae bacterium]|nr:phosphatase PAP2 family protein [Xanthobacteraceae bacterium]